MLNSKPKCVMKPHKCKKSNLKTKNKVQHCSGSTYNMTKLSLAKAFPFKQLRKFRSEQFYGLIKSLLPTREFFKDSLRFMKRCTKPDRREFKRSALATAIGFIIMGFIGYFVKLLHIPINNIIMSI